MTALTSFCKALLAPANRIVSRLHGMVWIAATMPFHLLSAATDFFGAKPALNNSVGAAILLAAGIQASIILIGSKMTTTRQSRARVRLFAAYLPIALLSVTLSYDKFDSTYEEHVLRLNEPVLNMDAMRDAAIKLGESITQGRALALSAVTNEMRYEDEQLAKINARIASDDYTHAGRTDADGEVMREQINSERAHLADLQAQWKSFSFNPANVATMADTKAAYSTLCDAQSAFTSLWGASQVNPSMTQGYQLPVPPAPALLEASHAKSRDNDPLLGPIMRLLPLPKSWLEPFWMGLAVLIEGIPFLLAWCGAATPEKASPAHPLDLEPLQDVVEQEREEFGGGDAAAISHRLQDRFRDFVRVPYLHDIDEAAVKGWTHIDPHMRPAIDMFQTANSMTAHSLAMERLEVEYEHRIKAFKSFAGRHGVTSDLIQSLVDAFGNRLQDQLALEETVFRHQLALQKLGFAISFERQFQSAELEMLPDDVKRAIELEIRLPIDSLTA